MSAGRSLARCDRPMDREPVSQGVPLRKNHIETTCGPHVNHMCSHVSHMCCFNFTRLPTYMVKIFYMCGTCEVGQVYIECPACDTHEPTCDCM